MSRVLITGARAPAALHLARLFAADGHDVVLADSFRQPLGRGTRLKRLYARLPAPRGNLPAYAGAVAGLVAREGIELVIPTCEEVFFLAAARDLHGAAIPLFAPRFRHLAQVHDKARFAALSRGLGADAPATRRLESREEVEALADPEYLVLKPVWSRFAERVLMRPDRAALGRIAPSAADPWVAQDYLPGDEICAYAVAVGGHLVAFQAYRPLYRAGRGAGLAFGPIIEPAALGFARGLAERLDWTGQISFDFRYDAAGALHVIECNPRAVSGLHFFGQGDGLPAAMLGGAPATPSLTQPMTLPLAMVCYGLPGALAKGRLGQWRRDFAGMADITAWPGEPGLLGQQVLALGEIAGLALRRGTGLKAAATSDIEWNGEDLSPL